MGQSRGRQPGRGWTRTWLCWLDASGLERLDFAGTRARSRSMDGVTEAMAAWAVWMRVSGDGAAHGIGDRVPAERTRGGVGHWAADPAARFVCRLRCPSVPRLWGDSRLVVELQGLCTRAKARLSSRGQLLQRHLSPSLCGERTNQCQLKTRTRSSDSCVKCKPTTAGIWGLGVWGPMLALPVIKWATLKIPVDPLCSPGKGGLSSVTVRCRPIHLGWIRGRHSPQGTVCILPLEWRAESLAPDAFPASPPISPHTFFAQGTCEAGHHCLQTPEKWESKATSRGGGGR